MRIIQLEEILLSPATYEAWMETSRRTVGAFVAAGLLNSASQIPDEQARIEDDETLTIFVDIPEVGEVSMKVPTGHWAWRQ